jgi:NADH-quinone oxidoreductase subunit K
VSNEATDLFMLCGIGVALTLIVGFYGLLVTKNLIRTMLCLEILTKGITLLIIIAGYSTGRIALAQTLAITLIIIEVAVVVVALGIILCLHKNTGSTDTDTVRNLKG